MFLGNNVDYLRLFATYKAITFPFCEFDRNLTSSSSRNLSIIDIFSDIEKIKIRCIIYSHRKIVDG